MKKLIVIILVFLIAVGFFTPALQAEESAFSTSDASSTSDSAFSTSSFGSAENEKELSWGGTLELDTRAILDKNGQSDIYSDPSLDLDLNYKKNNSEFEATLNFDEGAEDEVAIEEAFMRLYYENYDLVVGKKKEVWGKGDKLHVVDNLNGEDLTDFVNPEYLERQIGEEMVKMNYYLGAGTLEAVYTPNFTPDRLATNGKWVTSGIEEINSLEPNLISEFGAVGASKVQDSLDNNSQQEIEDGQIGLRYTNSKSGYDYGFSFYQGYLKRPSLNKVAINKLQKGLYTDYQSFLTDLDWHYDEVSVFGTELSAVIGGINSRAELAYYLTDDTEGNNAEVHNNKIAWLIGGDRDLPFHNLNLNLQVKSEYILDHEKIEENGRLDIEYNQDDEYLTNLLSLEVSDEFKNQTVLPSTTLVYNLESDDYYWDNELELKLKDDTSLIMSYKLFEGNEGTEFGQFDENDYLSAVFKYDF